MGTRELPCGVFSVKHLKFITGSMIRQKCIPMHEGFSGYKIG